MKVQLDKSNYSTVGRSSCLDHVQWMKAQSHQSRTINLCLFKCMYTSCTYLCVLRVCVCVCGLYEWGECVCVCGGGGGGGASPVICKSHEL